MTVSSESGLSAQEARNHLYDIMRQDTGVRDKAGRALELGKAYFDVANAHLTRIDPTAKYWQAVDSTDSPDGDFPPGLTLDLETTYCRRTIKQGSPIALHDAPNQGWADDPAFETHGLHCYLGVPITVTGETFGTACFVTETPRAEPFTEEEVMFADLIGTLLGHAFEQERYTTELTERKQLIDVLCRVLRHNLRNDLNVVRGHLEVFQEQSAGDNDATPDTLVTTIDELVELSEKTRPLSKLASESFDRYELDLAERIRELSAEVEERYPDASVAVETEGEAEIRAAPQVETALEELLVNAAKHAGATPSISVSLTRTSDALQIQVADDGPGLPDNERAILQTGRETPLEHGTGLGLWVVYWVVTRHEGSIDVTVSETGTTVTLTLPYGMTKVLPGED